MTLLEAQAYCTRLARNHYENFPVGLLVASHLRPHVHAIYAFARIADDYADEGYGPDEPPGQPRTLEERLAALDAWEAQLVESNPSHPVFVALHHTIRELDLPLYLFTDLLSAFKQDVVKRRYATYAEVLDYCRRSANPIGRLVLLVNGLRDRQLHLWSDAICTGLQLANFWQDVAVDLLKDRIYLPVDERLAFGVPEKELHDRHPSLNYRRLLAFQVARTRELFREGEPLSAALPSMLAWEIRMTWMGGSTILDKIEAIDFDTLSTRPRINRHDLFPLLTQSWFSRHHHA